MLKRMRQAVKALLLTVPGGRQFYNRLYLPWALRMQGHPPQAAPPQQEEIQDRPVDDAGYYRGVLLHEMAQQGDWLILLREFTSHMRYMNQLLDACASSAEKAAPSLLGFSQQFRTTILLLDALVARQETLQSWLRSILEQPSPPLDIDRVHRLERVIKYLVEVAGEPHASRPHWQR